MSFRGMLLKAGINPTGDGNVSVEGIISATNILQQSAKDYYVNRNNNGAASSGTGRSLNDAYLTIGEAIAAVNADYTAAGILSRGRMRRIIVAEGWYSETGLTLTASDVMIISVATGSRIADGSVLYGSATAGDFDAGAVTPALTITGSAVSVVGMGFMNSASGLYPCVSIGSSGSSGPTDVGFFDCFWPRDVADAYTYALVDYGNEGMRVERCYFSQSAKTGGILIASNGVVNPVSDRISDSIFVGTPVGIHQTAGHNTLIKGNWFVDASDDRPDTIDNPLNIVATSAFATGNFAPMNTLAEFDAGSVAVTLGNIGSDSDAGDWPDGG
jgi:hypothetical protein